MSYDIEKAAREWARRHHEKGSLSETVAVFAGMANARQFRDALVERLEERWQAMSVNATRRSDTYHMGKADGLQEVAAALRDGRLP